MPPTTLILTGSSRGIGLAILHSLSTSPPVTPLTIYATSRLGNPPSPAPKAAADVSINYAPLELSDHSTIKALFQKVKTEQGKVDVLINNAGVNLDDKYTPERVKQTMDSNVRGVIEMCQAFLPLMGKGGRIVNLSSTGSSLGLYSKDIQSRFRNPSMTFSDVEALMTEYEHAASTSSERAKGWPTQSYSVSKALTNAFTAVLARQHPDVLINCCCPGWVNTDMGNMVGPAPKRPEDGAKIPVRLAFGEIGGVSGRYWGNDSISGTGEGRVQEW